MPERHTYAPPVNQLLTLGEKPARLTPWLDYRALGLGPADIPALIHMATNDDLLFHTKDTDPRVFAPVHAWRALGELRAAEAADPLMALNRTLHGDDWYTSDLPQVFALIGKPALPVAVEVLRTAPDDALADENEYWDEEGMRITASEAISHIGMGNPDLVSTCAEILRRQLMRFEEQGDDLNAFLTLGLAQLGYEPADSLMRLAFAQDAVDEFVAGGYAELHAIMVSAAERKRAGLPLHDELDMIPIVPYLNKRAA